MTRTNYYIQTDNLNTIDLVDPTQEDLSLEPLAKAIAHLNRFTGHAGVYTVAQHCVYMTRILRNEGHDEEVQRGALVHDLHEAITGDVSSPVKRVLGEAWSEFERVHMQNIERQFDVRFIDVKPIHEADMRICVTEANQLLGGTVGPGWPDVDPYQIDITPWSPGRAFDEYLREAVRVGLGEVRSCLL